MEKSVKSQDGKSPLKRFTLFFLVGLVFLVLLGLGTWQVFRLQWKEDLIARVDARVHAEPIAAPDNWSQITRENSEYLHVDIDGKYLYKAQSFSYALTGLGDGYWVMTPMQLDNGKIIYVNRGFIPTSSRAAFESATPNNDTVNQHVSGLLRISEPKGAFLRNNIPDQNKWYSRDVAAMAAHAGLHQVAPYFIDADKNQQKNALPIGGLTQIKFPNSHLQYAITWYVMAILLLVALYNVRRSGKHHKE